MDPHNLLIRKDITSNLICYLVIPGNALVKKVHPELAPGTRYFLKLLVLDILLGFDTNAVRQREPQERQVHGNGIRLSCVEKSKSDWFEKVHSG